MKKILISLIALCFSIGFMSAQDMTNLENYRIYKMSEYLELTPEQAEVFFPLLRQYEKELSGVAREENALYESIRQRQKKGTIDQEELQNIMKQVANFENRRTQMKQQFMQRTRKVLSPGQVSRIPFFEKQFRQDLKREFIQRQRGKPGENNPGANPGRPENPGNPGGPGGRP